MSQLGNINSSYGHQFDIAVANTFAYNIEGALGLPENNMIISAPVDENNEDLGYSNILFTDANGEAVRFTYSINPTNIHIDGDNVSVETSDVFDTDENGLYVDMNRIVDNNTITYSGKLRVETSHLTKASTTHYGVGKIDENTLKVGIDGSLYVNTQALDKATNSSLGIVTSDNDTIDIIDGVVSVVTKNLVKGTEKEYGVIAPNGKTIISKDGTLYVNTESLDVASRDRYGISSPDGKTIKSKGGVYSVVTENLNKANDTRLGVVRLDPKCFFIENGNVVVVGYKELLKSLKELGTKYNELETKATKLETLINNGDVLKKKRTIQRLASSSTTTALLNHPKYMEEPINMKFQHVYINLDIVTTAAFHMSVDFKNNEAPVCEVTQVNYNDEFAVDGTRGLDYTFPSTNGKQKKLVIQLNCRNFNSTRLPYSLTTELKITLADASDHLINRSIYFAVVRYNSAIDENEYIKELAKHIVYTESYAASYWYADGDANHHKFNDPDDVPKDNTPFIYLHLVYYDNDGNSYVYEDTFDIAELSGDNVDNDTNMVLYSIDVTDSKGEKHTLNWRIYLGKLPPNYVKIFNGILNNYTIYKYNMAYIPICQIDQDNPDINYIPYVNSSNALTTYAGDIFYKYGENQISYLVRNNSVVTDAAIKVYPDLSYNVENIENKDLFNGKKYSMLAVAINDNSTTQIDRLTALPYQYQSQTNELGFSSMKNIKLVDPQISMRGGNFTSKELWSVNKYSFVGDLFNYTYTLNGIRSSVNYNTFSNSTYNLATTGAKIPSIIITPTNNVSVTVDSNPKRFKVDNLYANTPTSISAKFKPITNFTVPNTNVTSNITINTYSDINNMMIDVDKDWCVNYISGAYIDYSNNNQYNGFGFTIIELVEERMFYIIRNLIYNKDLNQKLFKTFAGKKLNVFFMPMSNYTIIDGKLSGQLIEYLKNHMLIFNENMIKVFGLNTKIYDEYVNYNSNSIIHPKFNKQPAQFNYLFEMLSLPDEIERVKALDNKYITNKLINKLYVNKKLNTNMFDVISGILEDTANFTFVDKIDIDNLYRLYPYLSDEYIDQYKTLIGENPASPQGLIQTSQTTFTIKNNVSGAYQIFAIDIIR